MAHPAAGCQPAPRRLPWFSLRLPLRSLRLRVECVSCAEPDELYRNRLPLAASLAAARSAFRDARSKRPWRRLRADLPAGARVLDAGSGEGQYRHHFARQRYCGVDLAVGDAAWDYSRIDALADLTALPFRAGRFDAAIHIVTIEHLKEPGCALAEIGAHAGGGRHAADRGAARVGSSPGAARLFPLHALRPGVSAGEGRLRSARDARRRRLFPAAGPAAAQRATILHRRRSLAAVPSGRDAAGPSRRCFCRSWTLSTGTGISRSATSARRANAPEP